MATITCMYIEQLFWYLVLPDHPENIDPESFSDPNFVDSTNRGEHHAVTSLISPTEENFNNV